ncbi:A24 family peptidase [Mycobacterium sp.]|uniref:A24 family peptidase n=1 Tax=Mycobacterium sp. TaxID=1785 RepID=UPI002D9A3C2E|nr:A24 family peptidase [Mycobacterium sp.]
MGAGLAGAGVLAWLVALSAFDIRSRRLPDYLTLPGAAVVLVGAVVAGRGAAAVLGAAALFAVYLVVYLLRPSAMGAGDVKLAIGVGGLTGAFGVDVWALSAVGAPLLTAGLILVAMLCRAGSTVPHGPSMCLAAVAACALAAL